MIFEFIKVIVVPALISLCAYLLITFVILPFLRQNYHRYDQYLPLHSISGSLASRTSSFRERIGNSLIAFILPSSRRWRDDRIVDGAYGRAGSTSEDDDLFGAEEAEDMVGFNIRDVSHRREELRRDMEGMESASRSAALSSMPQNEST